MFTAFMFDQGEFIGLSITSPEIGITHRGLGVGKGKTEEEALRNVLEEANAEIRKQETKHPNSRVPRYQLREDFSLISCNGHTLFTTETIDGETFAVGIIVKDPTFE